MKLRELEENDAPLMLEWMHDLAVVRYLQSNFTAKTIDDCKDFIEAAKGSGQNLHLAIADENNVYMGTVSLKHITNDTAEFGIAVRTIAMGKGFSTYAMEKIIKYGFEKLNLRFIFWCVSQDNTRALRFYDKNGYERINMKRTKIEGYTKEQIDKYIWYEVRRQI